MSTATLFLWSPVDDSVLLATLDVPPSSRVAMLSQRWCERARIDAKVLAVFAALGRRDGSLDWGVWVRCDAQLDGHQRWPLSHVARCASQARDRRLAAALITVIRRSPQWIGLNPAWPELVREWIADALQARVVADALPLRADATALVARCQVAGRNVFFTARPFPFHDPELCDVLRDHAPSAFPKTLAVDRERGWWLTADVGGLDAARYVDRDRNRATSLLGAIANVQLSTLGSSDLERLSFRVTRETVLESVERLADDERAAILGGVGRLWTDGGADEAPLGWMHSDPSPDNIRVDDEGGIIFFDLEDPWYGPTPLMGALAIHSMSRRRGWEDTPGLCIAAWRRYADVCGLGPHHTLDSWLRLAQLVRLIRRVERSATESPLLLEEEVPRRSWAIQSKLRRLCRR